MITTEIKQTTISKPISLSGVGLHTGQEVKLTFKPAKADKPAKTDKSNNGKKPNRTLGEAMQKNLDKVGGVKYTSR